MSDFTMRYVNVALEGYSIVICAVLIVYQLFHMDTYRSQKRWFCFMLLANIAMMLGDMTDWLFNGVETPMAFVLGQYGMCLFYGASGLLLLTLTWYLTAFMELDTRSSRWIKKVAVLLAGVQVILSVSAHWNGLYFYYTDKNVYVRGPLYPLSQMIPALMYVMDAALIIIGRKKLRLITRVFLSSYIILPLIGQLLQSFFYGGAYINVMATLAMLLVNINVQNEQEKKMKEREKELAEARIDIMLSQIRPHFLYNALTAIRQLCDKDPEQAKQSIFDFSRFLRANMNSLTAKEPIPFDKELEHVKNYLNLEQQRFGKRLRVVYDIGSRDFVIPTLTLQPIVENAVRHGIMKKAEGGVITIHTEKQREGHVIVVTDTGAGFREMFAASDDSSHIGLENVKRRLWIQCQGKLNVQSSEEGTVVTIWIPKEEGRAE